MKANTPVSAIAGLVRPAEAKSYADAAAPAEQTFTMQNCVDTAKTRPVGGRDLTRDDSFNLCAGSAKPEAPLACLEKALGHSIAYQYRLNLKQGIQLCGGTSVAEAPVTCLDRTVSQTIGGYSLTLEYGLQLCGGTSEPLAPLVCLDRAVSPVFGAPASLDAALQTCRSRQESYGEARKNAPAVFTPAGY